MTVRQHLAAALGLALLAAPAAAQQEVVLSYVSPVADITDGPGQTLIGLREDLARMGIKYKMFSAVPPVHNDPIAYDRILGDQLSIKPQYLLVTPAAGLKDIFDRINEATRAGIKVIVLNAPPIGLDDLPIKPLAYVVVPEDKMGQMAGRTTARFACERKRNPVNLAMFHGIPTSEIGNLRSKNFIETFTTELKNCGATLNLRREVWTEFNREMAFRTSESVMTAHPDINVIFGANSNTALGVMEGLQGRQIKLGADGVWIVGQGGQLDELAAVCRGDLITAPFRDPRSIARKAAEVIKLDLDGKGAQIQRTQYIDLTEIYNCEQVFQHVPRAMLDTRGFRPLIPAAMWRN